MHQLSHDYGHTYEQLSKYVSYWPKVGFFSESKRCKKYCDVTKIILCLCELYCLILCKLPGYVPCRWYFCLLFMAKMWRIKHAMCWRNWWATRFRCCSITKDEDRKTRDLSKSFRASFQLCMVCFGALAVIFVECMISCSIFQICCVIWELCGGIKCVVWLPLNHIAVGECRHILIS